MIFEILSVRIVLDNYTDNSFAYFIILDDAGECTFKFRLAFFPKFPTSHYFMREREKKKVISLKCFKTFSVQIILQLATFDNFQKTKRKSPKGGPYLNCTFFYSVPKGS